MFVCVFRLMNVCFYLYKFILFQPRTVGMGQLLGTMELNQWQRVGRRVKTGRSIRHTFQSTGHAIWLAKVTTTAGKKETSIKNPNYMWLRLTALAAGPAQLDLCVTPSREPNSDLLSFFQKSRSRSVRPMVLHHRQRNTLGVLRDQHLQGWRLVHCLHQLQLGWEELSPCPCSRKSRNRAIGNRSGRIIQRPNRVHDQYERIPDRHLAG